MPSDKQQLDSLKRLHNSTNEAVTNLEKENAELKAKVSFLERSLESCTKNLEIQKQIVRDNITQSAQNEANLVVEIEKLRKKLKAK